MKKKCPLNYWLHFKCYTKTDQLRLLAHLWRGWFAWMHQRDTYDSALMQLYVLNDSLRCIHKLLKAFWFLCHSQAHELLHLFCWHRLGILRFSLCRAEKFSWPMIKWHCNQKWINPASFHFVHVYYSSLLINNSLKNQCSQCFSVVTTMN